MTENVKNDNVLIEIAKRAETLKDIKKIVLFGSRARGDNRYNSDYDIAVYGDVSEKNKIEFQYYCDEETFSLCKFDIIFIDSLANEKLLKNIENDGRVIYEQI